jgi:C4-dicarboxylate-specific signal transduction histidine kinase
MAVLESPPEAGGGAKGKVLDLLREVERETKRAGEIISRLRSFVRKKAPHRVPVEVAGLIENAAKLMGADLRLQTVRLSVDVPDGLRVKADPVQIEQVLVNLIRNAVEAMASVPVPARRLVIGASPDGAASVEVSVADTGAGFAAGQEERIFDSFFTTKPDGIGVGLTISRSIVEAHGGRLTTAANPGGGVMFRFTLPSFMPDSEGVSYEP